MHRTHSVTLSLRRPTVTPRTKDGARRAIQPDEAPSRCRRAEQPQATQDTWVLPAPHASTDLL